MTTKLLKTIANNPANQKYAKAYCDTLSKAVKNKSPKNLMMKQWVNMMIQRIECAKKVVETEGYDQLHPKVKEGFNLYDIIDNDGVKLVLKGNETQPAKEIVAFEDSYNCVVMAHIATDHGDAKEMAEWLSSSNILVAEICCTILIKLCVKCQIGEYCELSINARKPGGLINIVDMSEFESSDTKFDCLLIYLDINTNFLQLRPMSSADLMDSISNELTHLFSELGPPNCITVQESLHSVFLRVVNDRLNVLFDHKIDIAIDDTSLNIVTVDVHTAITKWIEQEPEGKWYMGSFIVQWEMNNVNGELVMSSLEKLTGRRYTRIAVNDKEVPEED